jgi:hypothetical protein
MERGGGRPTADHRAVTGELRANRFLPVGSDGMGEDEADRLLRCPATRPRDTGDRDSDLSAEPLADPVRHGGCGLGRDSTVASSTRAGTPRLACFTSSAYATIEPTKRRRSGNCRQPRSDHPSGARLAVASFRPAWQRSRTISATDLSCPLKRYVASCVRSASATAHRETRPLIDEEVDVDLELAGTDGHLHPIALTPRRGQRLCDS